MLGCLELSKYKKSFKKICFVVSDPMTANAFLANHIAALSETYEVTLIANFSKEQLKEGFNGARLKKIEIVRNISLFYDFSALSKLIFYFLNERFDVVHSVTPKAGLLAMVASYLARTECRFHTFTGQVWVGKREPFRWLLKCLDKLMFYFSTFSLVDSPTQRDFLIEESVITDVKSGVICDGSISGVDLNRFMANNLFKQELRKSNNIPLDAFVFLFLGRVSRDKGIEELILAFSKLDYVNCSLYLFVVGSEEDDVLVRCEGLLSKAGSHIVRSGFTKSPEVFMAAADVFCLPSYREGFGSVIIEAAACEIPALGSNIYGIKDAILNGATGYLHAARSVDDLSLNMQRMAENREETRLMGVQARARAQKLFSSERIVDGLLDFYDSRT